MEKIFVTQAEIDAAEHTLCPYGASAAGRLAANNDVVAKEDNFR
ncbi:hypothetical protein [Blastopirellula sp. J2-11]|nr:hypothetical protein [Blastopirellula sp. J2-11]